MRLKDYTGTNYGCYYIECRLFDTGKYGVIWKGICTYCGREHHLASGNMRRNTGKVCKCLSVKMNRSPCWTGYGEISGSFYAQIRRGAGGAYSRSGRRNITRKGREHVKFSLTVKELWELAEKQDIRCALTGEKLVFHPYEQRTASLDRIDNTGDYTLDNVQWVHKDVNRMKNVFTQERFVEVCKSVAKFYTDKNLDNQDPSSGGQCAV